MRGGAAAGCRRAFLALNRPAAAVARPAAAGSAHAVHSAAATGASAAGAGTGRLREERLGGRGVLRLAGPDAVVFLQGLVTNDVAKLQPGGSQYAVMLNAQGRFLYDLFITARAPAGATPELLLDVERESLPELLAALRRYKLRAKVDVADVSAEHVVLAQWDPTAACMPTDAAGLLPEDPRGAFLGCRGLVPPESTAAEKSAPLEEVGCSPYSRWRLRHGVAEGGMEIPRGAALPLQYNLGGLRAISFEKGCYVGQELTARTQFRGVIRKRAMPVWLGADCGAAAAYDWECELGVPVCGAWAMAMLRLGPALGPQAHLQIDGGGPHVWPQRPAWWPVTWGHESTGPDDE